MINLYLRAKLMKLIYVVLAIALLACSENKRGKEQDTGGAAVQSADSLPGADGRQTENTLPIDTYANSRFRKVTVEKTGDHQYTVRGEGQLFEATFGWAVEDGHNELKTGFGTASMGAPEWGSFEFTVEVEKARPNSTLMLILFEESAKDGSRQHELPVRLE